MMKGKNQLLTPEEVAEMLQIARKTVVVMAREGRIPCIRIGRFVRFDPAAIDRWLDRQRS
jgi:excisionase family DNA binding protein